MDFDKLGVQVLFVCMTSKSNNTIIFLINISRHSSSINLNVVRHITYCIFISCKLFVFQVLLMLFVCLFVCCSEENRDLMGRSGFFRRCSKKWLFPSIQDAMRHAQYEPVLVSWEDVVIIQIIRLPLVDPEFSKGGGGANFRASVHNVNLVYLGGIS